MGKFTPIAALTDTLSRLIDGGSMGRRRLPQGDALTLAGTVMTSSSVGLPGQPESASPTPASPAVGPARLPHVGWRYSRSSRSEHKACRLGLGCRSMDQSARAFRRRDVFQ